MGGVGGVGGGEQTSSATDVGGSPSQAEAALDNARTATGSLDIDKLAAEMASMTPAARAAASMDVINTLTPVQRGQLTAALDIKPLVQVGFERNGQYFDGCGQEMQVVQNIPDRATFGGLTAEQFVDKLDKVRGAQGPLAGVGMSVAMAVSDNPKHHELGFAIGAIGDATAGARYDKRVDEFTPAPSRHVEPMTDASTTSRGVIPDNLSGHSFD